MRNIPLRTITFGAALSAALTLSLSGTAQADGDGDCTDTGNICVYDGTEWGATGGHYDLNDPHSSLAGLDWIGGGTGDVNDDISSMAVRGPYTSCIGFVFWKDTGYSGAWKLGFSYNASPATLDGTIYNNAISSFKKDC
ncbi:peptidase inhibitor family I36 protein [Streptomyces sp. STR69]|uniref:peptidase inhibitor family I36 protein n=1 Tax=Streptomyces sp. STR69 TaxID=1796942 RepID=UPI0021C6D813|nr:peptidase inhibitor family I36 protein [Streptomyces sp. STR69]